MFIEGSAFSLPLLSNLQTATYLHKIFINPKSEIEMINSFNREDEKSIK